MQEVISVYQRGVFISKGIAEADEFIHIKKMFHKQSGRARKGRVRVGVGNRI